MCRVKSGCMKPCLVEVNRSLTAGVRGPSLDICCYFSTYKKKKKSNIGRSETAWMLLVTGVVQYDVSFDKQLAI